MFLNRISPQDAAQLINNGDTIGFSGFTAAGSPKVIAKSIAQKAQKEHLDGRDFKLGIVTGASNGRSLDGVLAKANAVAWRTPYQSDPHMRNAINNGRVCFFDMHLSQVAQHVRYGFLGKIQWAIIEACDVSVGGEIVLTTGVGCAPTLINKAEKIIIELNSRHPKTLRGFHDIYEPECPPHRQPIPLTAVNQRIGTTTIKVDPQKIVGIIETHGDDETAPFRPCDEITMKIGNHVANFLVAEMNAGRIPKCFLPLQSGVGETANAVLVALGKNDKIPPFQMYTEVIQDAAVDLIKAGKITFASGSSLTVSPQARQDIYDDLDFYRDKIILRPQEISNNPEVIRRLGVISCNTAIEADIFGNVNSTHILGDKIMNGIGGSGDFTRNAYISIFICPSTQKQDNISTIVHHVSHVDHSEHDVMVLATEWGVADLRSKSPTERARTIIDNCAHPDFRNVLHEHLDRYASKHTPTQLNKAYELHKAFIKTGTMRQGD